MTTGPGAALISVHVEESAWHGWIQDFPKGGRGANSNAWLCHSKGVKERAEAFAMAGDEGPGAWSLPQDVGICYYHVMIFP